jgi:hypothetical protein
MRVLWFTDLLPRPVTLKLGVQSHFTGSWMDNLRLALQDNSTLELGVVTNSEIDFKPFVEDGTVFYNILSPPHHGTLGSIFRRWLHTKDFPNGVRDCLYIIREFKPDLIHVHGSENFYGRIINKTPVPVVLSIQGILSVIEKHYFGGFTCKDRLVDIFSLKFLKGVGAIHGYLRIKKSAHREKQILNLC